MRWFNELIAKRKERWHKNAINGAESEAKRLYQIKEYDSHLWLTYNDALIVPFDLICDSSNTEQCIELLKTTRDLYVKRMIGKTNEDER